MNKRRDICEPQGSPFVSKSAKLVSALLVTTAFTAPAFAQIETVVVTAERKAEDIQTVPVAVTALTGADLKAKQVNSSKDLQFHVPSVTFTKSNFGGAQFQIRGITTQFGLGAAIAQNENDVYQEAPALVNGQYFDVDRVEVSRGPQSTSYGRAATGGAVNIITSKPNLEEFQARASFDYGTYDTMKPELMVNVPLIDNVLGIRIAALGVFHDGYEKNDYNVATDGQVYPGKVDNRINGQGTASGRFSVRFEPNDDTTIDLVGEIGYENDNRVRGDKQGCARDPSGVIGCLPYQMALQPLNVLSTLGATLGSKQGLTAVLSAALPYTTAQTLGNTLGLFNLAGNGASGDPGNPLIAAGIRGVSLAPDPFTGAMIAPGEFLLNPQGVNGVGSGANGQVSQDLLTSNTSFSPKFKGSSQQYMLNWAQTVTSWLKATVDAGYSSSYSFTQQNYNDATPENIGSLIAPAEGAFFAAFGAGTGTPGFLGGSNASGAYNQYFASSPGVPNGTLPLSNTNYAGHFGSYAGSIAGEGVGVLTNTPYFSAYDEDDFASREWTGEVRFQTSFSGPLNFTAGAFFMSFDSRNQYWVASNGLDYESLVIGAIQGAPTNTPLALASPDYDGESRRGAVQSRSMFLEGTYDFSDDLKLIAGARYNDDRSSAITTTPAIGGLLLANSAAGISGLVPIGSQTCANPGGIQTPGAFCVGWPGTFRLPTDTGATADKSSVTDKWTGRLTLNWSPKTSFTDQTLLYVTLSRGELAGGVNKAEGSGSTLVVPTVYQPATVDAAEVGAKNTLFDGTLQANLDAWYYNYENYQVGIIDNRAALEFNIPAHLYGAEGEFVWQPEDDLSFNLSLSLTRSEAGNAYIVDQRNPTANTPNTILVKDLTNGSLCTIQPITAAATGHTPGESSAFHVNNFYLPNGGNAAIDAPFGVPLVNYGLCQGNAGPAVPGTTRAALNAAGFDYTADAFQNGTLSNNNFGSGIATNVKGNRLPDVPNAQVGLGGQYTFHFADYTLVPRVDYYWQSSMEARVNNDPGSDYIAAWDTMNGQIQLNAPDNAWYVRVFATNIFDKRNPTGEYLTDPTSALYTNLFVEDPRVVGVSLGASW
jgi:iron complex outermembrane recepter protein